MIFLIIKTHIELLDPLCYFYFNWEIIINHLEYDINIICRRASFSYPLGSQASGVPSVTNVQYINTYAYIRIV